MQSLCAAPDCTLVSELNLMKVLVLTNMYPSASDPAHGVFVKTQVESLTELGVHCELEIIRGKSSRLDYLWAVKRVRRWVRSGGFDVVHAHYGTSGVVALSQKRCPTVVSFCGSDLLGEPDGHGGTTPLGALQTGLSRWAARNASEVIVKSAELGRALGVQRKFHVIPNGVDFEIFRPIERARACEQLSLDPAVRRVLFAGRVGVPRKRFPLIQQAVAALSAQGDQVDLMTFSGRPQNELALAMNASDVLVLASIHEGSPNVVKEAMASNLSVVSTRVGDVEELFGDEPGYFLADPTVDDIKDKISSALAFGRTRGRDKIAHLSLPNVAARVLKVYEAARADFVEGASRPVS